MLTRSLKPPRLDSGAYDPTYPCHDARRQRETGKVPYHARGSGAGGLFLEGERETSIEDPTKSFEGLREPISEGVRVLLIDLLNDTVKGLQQAIRWLQALEPMQNRTVGEHVFATASAAATRLARRLSRQKS